MSLGSDGLDGHVERQYPDQNKQTQKDKAVSKKQNKEISRLIHHAHPMHPLKILKNNRRPRSYPRLARRLITCSLFCSVQWVNGWQTTH
jgi:hypothetical protein